MSALWDTAESGYMTHEQRESADEVIAQYDLPSAEQKEARRLVAARMWESPYYPHRAYHEAHNVCAELVRESGA